MNSSTSQPSLRSASGSTRTPVSATTSSRTPGITRSLRSSTLKRDSSAAMLGDEPHPTSSKRALLSSTLTAASTERQLASLQTTNHSLTSKLRETEHELASVQRDRRFLADREKAEREAREENEKTWESERKKYALEVQKLRASLAKMEEQNEETKDGERKMKEEVGKARRELDRKEMENMRIKGELDNIKLELRSTKRDLQRSLQECAGLEEKIGKENEDVIEKAAKEIEDRFVKEMEDERKSMEETLEEVLKEKDAEIEELKGTIDEQQKEWAKMEEYAEDLERQLREANTKLADEEKTRTEALALASRAMGRHISELPSPSSQIAMDVDSTLSSSQPVATQPEPSTPSKNNTGTLSNMSLATPSSVSRIARQAITNRMSTPRRSSISTFSNSPLRRRTGELSPGPSLSTPLKIEILKRDPDADVLGPHLTSLTNHLRKVESENVKLRAELGVLRGKDESIQVLKEENMSLQARIKRQEKEIEKLVKASTSSPSLTSSVNTPSSRSVQETNELAKLRLEHANLLEKFGEVKAELAGLKNAGPDEPMTQSSGGPELSEGKVNEETSDEREATKQRMRMKERELDSVKKELEFVKGMMDSYATELQLATPNAGLGTSPAPLNELNSRRVIQLEQLLGEAKDENAKLREEIETILVKQKPAQEPTVNPDLVRINQLQAQVTTLEETITVHLATIDNLEQELFELRGEIAGGRHVPPNLRILKSTEAAPGDYDPSASTKTSTPQPLSNDDLVPKETLMSALREGKRLQEELERKEKRLLRLKEIFNSKSAEFREAVGALLGIKLAFYPNGQVRITSLYDMTATFVFSPSKHDLKMQLIGVGTEDGPPQDWRENLPNWQSYWIEQEQCIPGFLATVTLEVYDRWKSKGGGG